MQYRLRREKVSKIKRFNYLEYIRDKESQYYMEGMLSNALDKTTEDRAVYKETINKMCEKYKIEHGEVYDIIDQVKIERENKQRER